MPPVEATYDGQILVIRTGKSLRINEQEAKAALDAILAHRVRTATERMGKLREAGQIFLVKYMCYGAECEQEFETFDEAIAFLANGEDMNTLAAVSITLPGGEILNKTDLAALI